MYKYILGLDPSGNFEEGKGTTGVCLAAASTKQKPFTIIKSETIKASSYKTKEEYWQAHIKLVAKYATLYKDLIVVVEDFTLNPRRALQQSHSKMETSKLIGVLQMACAEHNWQIKMQLPVEAKSRWADSILEHKRIIKRVSRGHISSLGYPISRHEKDAIRHAVHYSTFYNK